MTQNEFKEHMKTVRDAFKSLRNTMISVVDGSAEAYVAIKDLTLQNIKDMGYEDAVATWLFSVIAAAKEYVAAYQALKAKADAFDNRTT